MNILAVGAAGHIGGAVTDQLPAEGRTVRIHDALLHEAVCRTPVDFVFGDIRGAAQSLPYVALAHAVVGLSSLPSAARISR